MLTSSPCTQALQSHRHTHNVVRHVPFAPVYHQRPLPGSPHVSRCCSSSPSRYTSRPHWGAVVHNTSNPSTKAALKSSLSVHSSLADYICSGPLLKVCGISQSDVQREIETWERLGRRLAVQLKFDHDNMDNIQRLRVYHYYLPVFFWVQQQHAQHLNNQPSQNAPAFVVSSSSIRSDKAAALAC